MGIVVTQEGASAPATPATGYWVWYALARGLEYKDDAGNVRRLGIATSTANVSDPPTDEELDSAFGQPADVGAGFIAILDDAGGGANVYLVASDGAGWWYAALTQAT